MKYTLVRDVKEPQGNRDEDAGIDFFVPNDFNDGKVYLLRIGEQVNIPSGVLVKIKKTQCLRMENKSGVAIKKGVTRGACVIDSGYRGEIHINLQKGVKGSEDIRIRKNGFLGFLGFKEWATEIKPGEKIIQGIIEPISTEDLEKISNKEYKKGPKTKRAAKGFGSTGTK